MDIKTAVLLCVVPIIFRILFVSIQIDRCQMRIMEEGGAWRGNCVKFREIVFKIHKWGLKHFKRE